MDVIKNHFYYLTASSQNFSVVIRITILLMLLLMGIYFISLIKIGVMVYRTKREKKRRQKVKERYEYELFQLLYTQDNVSASQIVVELGLENQKLKDWEKACISDLLVQMIQGKYEI